MRFQYIAYSTLYAVAYACHALPPNKRPGWVGGNEALSENPQNKGPGQVKQVENQLCLGEKGQRHGRG